MSHQLLNPPINPYTHKSTILITGFTGFVGTNMLPFLTKNNVGPIYGVSRSDVRGGDLKVISWDELLNNPLPEKVDTVIHLAGKAHDLRRGVKYSDYEKANVVLTQKLFDQFSVSRASKFIYLSSIKAVGEDPSNQVNEESTIEPNTYYGRSKAEAEKYIIQNCPKDKHYYVLRPALMYGPGIKGNMKLFHDLVSKNIPYPLGKFENQRSYLSVTNLNIVIAKILEDTPPSGIYHLADDESISTLDLIRIIAEIKGKKPRVWNVPANLIKLVAKIGDIVPLPLNSNSLEKLTGNMLVSNAKVKRVFNLKFPVSAANGLKELFREMD